MQQITTIGLDLAKQVFQVHGAEADGSPVVSRTASSLNSRVNFRRSMTHLRFH